MKHAALLLSALLLSSCYAMVGTKKGVAPDSAHTCANFCRDMNLELASVIVMADNVGCVCNPKGAATSTNTGPAAAGGMASIVQAQQEEEERARQQQAKNRY